MSIAEKFEIIADAVYDAGAKSEYDRFWDNYQNYGLANSYVGAFAGRWVADIFNPKYDIEVKNGGYMFYSNTIDGLDLREDKFKEKYGVGIDLSNATNLHYFLSYSNVEYVGVVSFTLISNPSVVFANAMYLKGINKIIVSENISATAIAFTRCNSLTDVYFEGIIPCSVNFQWSPLNKASIESVVNHLSTTVTGQTVTFNKTAVNAAFGIDIDDETTYTDEFNTLRNSKSNWTFSYA